jgi:predicted RNA-binding protein with PUA-like domain
MLKYRRGAWQCVPNQRRGSREERVPAKWLLKSDPQDYSFEDLRRAGKTVWDGVSNNLALINLRAMRRGDLAIIYHTGEERAAVGIVELVSDPYPDPKKKDPRLVVVDLKARGKLRRPVSLDEIKKEPALAGFDLVRLPRLSVMPVSEAQWAALMALAEKAP